MLINILDFIIRDFMLLPPKVLPDKGGSHPSSLA